MLQSRFEELCTMRRGSVTKYQNTFCSKFNSFVITTRCRLFFSSICKILNICRIVKILIFLAILHNNYLSNDIDRLSTWLWPKKPFCRGEQDLGCEEFSPNSLQCLTNSQWRCFSTRPNKSCRLADKLVNYAFDPTHRVSDLLPFQDAKELADYCLWCYNPAYKPKDGAGQHTNVVHSSWKCSLLQGF